MISDSEIRERGIQVLSEHLGDVEAERFIALIQRESFDYTKWRQTSAEGGSVEEISKAAMSLREERDGYTP